MVSPPGIDVIWPFGRWPRGCGQRATLLHQVAEVQGRYLVLSTIGADEFSMSGHPLGG